MTYPAPKIIIFNSSKVCNVVKRRNKTWFKQNIMCTSLFYWKEALKDSSQFLSDCVMTYYCLIMFKEHNSLAWPVRGFKNFVIQQYFWWLL